MTIVLPLARVAYVVFRFLAGALAVFPKACSFALETRGFDVRHVQTRFVSHPAAAASVIGRMVVISWSFKAHSSYSYCEYCEQARLQRLMLLEASA